jgi:hypothetical protein
MPTSPGWFSFRHPQKGMVSRSFTLYLDHSRSVKKNLASQTSTAFENLTHDPYLARRVETPSHRERNELQ